MRRVILEVATTFKPDITFMQLQRADIVTASMARAMPGKIMNWTGDVRSPIPSHYRDLAPHIHTTGLSNMTDVESFRLRNLRSDYLQTGFDERVNYPIRDPRLQVTLCSWAATTGISR